MSASASKNLIRASLIALAGGLLMSSSAMAACGPGYKPVKWQNSGNTVCVLDAAAGNNTLATPTTGPGPTASKRPRRLQIKKAKRRIKLRRRHK